MLSAYLATARRIALGVVLLFVLIAVSGFGACSNYGLGNIYGNPSPTPGVVVPTPASLALTCLVPAGTFTVSQIYFSGTFTAMSSSTHVTVAATSPPNTFVVTQDNQNGAGATITITGGGGQTGTVTVTDQACICVRHHDMWETPRLKL